MERLKDFKKNEIDVRTFLGGRASTNIITTQKERNTSTDGSCCEISKDYFCDSNGDGIWSAGEPGQTTNGVWVWTCG